MRSLLCLAALAAAATMAAPPAQAYHHLTKGGQCPNGWVFPADPSYSVNTSLANDPVEAAALSGLVGDIMDRFNAIGGSGFDFVMPPGTTTDAFAIGDADGVNEIGWADLSGTGAGAMGPTIVDTTTCTVVEANVLIARGTTWRYEVPWVYGNKYYRTHSVEGGERYLREVAVHELGHNLSLAHTGDSYDFMNRGASSEHARPFANRDDDQMVDPLPDMRRALRTLYPVAGTEKDMGVLTTWFDDGNLAVPAPQRLLCRPSGGTALSADIFSDRCGVTATGAPGSTQVCPGDRVYVRFALPNYGNVAMSATLQLWFSADEVLDRSAGSGDLVSATTSVQTVSASGSKRVGMSFVVPPGVTRGATYYPILFADTGADYTLEESQQNNWIPLRTAITICP